MRAGSIGSIVNWGGEAVFLDKVRRGDMTVVELAGVSKNQMGDSALTRGEFLCSQRCIGNVRSSS